MSVRVGVEQIFPLQRRLASRGLLSDDREGRIFYLILAQII